MTKPNEHVAYFTLVGDFDPKDITVRLGIEPTKSWKKGDVNPQTHYERNHSRWCLNSRLGAAASFEEHVGDVLDQLKPHTPELLDLRTIIDGNMQLVGYFHTSYPGFRLSEITLAELARLRLGIDCDFYYLYSDKREDSN